MEILGPIVLPADVAVVPVADLTPDLREQIGHEPDDYCITRPRTRTTSSVVDARTAALLQRFRTPATIVDAVIAFSAAEGLDPRATLDGAFTVLGGFLNEGVLVPADSELAQPIATTMRAGDRVGSFELVEAVHVIADSEVYLARAPDGSPVALKLARPGAGSALEASFAREAAILGHLDGRASPRLLELKKLDGRPFLATSWCHGVDAYQAAAEARALGEPDGRDALLGLAMRVLEAYAHLHAQGIVHGDVHPRNLLVGADGGVAIIDYGLAARPAAPGTPSMESRGGVDFFLEPELAAARLAGRPPPAVTAAGEQYALGALLYLLLTGAHTRAFSLEREAMLRQVLEQPPLPFERHGAGDLASVERTVRRALAKDPAARYRSVGTFLRAFRAAAARDRETAGGARAGIPERGGQGRGPGSGPARQLLEEVLARLAVGGELFAGGLAAPTASTMNGGAGFAYALLRIAGSRGDPALLALADLWSTRAGLATKNRPAEAFWNPDLEIVPEIFGRNSFYHHACGVHAVQALVARARGDEWSQRLATEAFVAAASQPCEHLDVAFGRAGLLLGSALLLDALPPVLLDAAGPPLLALGGTLRESVWSELARHPAIGEDAAVRTLGAAHGWAGFLFALLRWSQASATPPPHGLVQRLDQLAALSHPAGRGLRWPYATGAAPPDSAMAASWCNGAAGYVHLWTLAHHLLGHDRFATLAELAAWTAYTAQDGGSAPGDLCCGLAGRAYALLCLYHHTGEPLWLARARALADLAATSIRHRSLRHDSLYKGDIGVALLASDLQAPYQACMPLFAAER